jgi:glycosyltransferase involved in cell wall biosynthesis
MRFRHSSVLDRLLKIVAEASKWQCNHDALNFVCKGEIASLDARWNVQLCDYYARKQIALMENEIWIAHFTGAEKPWKSPVRCYSHLWWLHVDNLSFAVATWHRAFDVDDAAVCLGEGVAVSVIVPIYNAESYLVQMLVSLAAQTLRNIEVICVDDGSTDGSGAICERFAAVDTRFRILHQTNSGAAVARNRGIDEARGRWLFFADADDFCRPDMLERLFKRGEEFAADVVIAGHYVIDTRFVQQVDEQSVSQKNLLAGDVVRCTTDGVDVFSGSCTVLWNKFFRRDFVVENGIRFHQIPPSDDVYFSLVSLVNARRLCFIDRSFYYYRRFLPTSQMGVEEAQAPTNFLKAFLEVKNVLEGCELQLQKQFFRVAISVCFMNFARRYTIEGIRKTYHALRDGGIQALQFKDVDDQSIDLGSWRNLYDLTKAGADLDEVLLALHSARMITNTAKMGEQKCRKINDLRALVEKRDEMLAKRDASINMYRNQVATLERDLNSRDTEIAATNRDIYQPRKELVIQNKILSKIDACINSASESN